MQTLEQALETSSSARPLTGRIALVTGSGQGLGFAIARSLAEAGATLIVADIRADTASAAAQRLQAAGVDASALTLDVSDELRDGIERTAVVARRGHSAAHRQERVRLETDRFDLGAAQVDADLHSAISKSIAEARARWQCGLGVART